MDTEFSYQPLPTNPHLKQIAFLCDPLCFSVVLLSMFYPGQLFYTDVLFIGMGARVAHTKQRRAITPLVHNFHLRKNGVVGKMW